MPALVNWYTNQLANYGTWPVMAAQAGAFVAVVFGAHTAIWTAERRRDQRALRTATDHHKPRKEDTP